MSKTQTNSTNAPDIDRPICARCGSQMWLARISPAVQGREWRTFECPVCEVSTEADDTDHRRESGIAPPA
ncbi:hypothetical protein ASD45_04990 [Pseudolabrys sp. Root1462]|jgi:hypothetical protein|uniref:hypothetical protein n=1 Tax=Pseudolabrys sp. Root1462 TaxID=1736466 RepID=UPI0007026C26|nr:hypothetical protein [Pseudolabrys sp. Root1462]KQZ00286.1 hypothetical protein ASD45_04990 [Pseudolabrys sp. Root1462]